MTSGFNTMLGQFEMTLWRSRDVNHIWPTTLEQCVDILKTPLDANSISQLPCHERFFVGHAYNLSISNARDLARMSIGDLSAANNAYPYH